MARSSPLTRTLLSLSENVVKVADRDDSPEMSKIVNDTRRLITVVLDDIRFSDEIPKDLRQSLIANLGSLL